MKRLARLGLLRSLTKVKLSICEHCLARKATRLPFDKAKRATNKGLVFLGEEANGGVTKFESQDVLFLEEDYPTRGEIDKDFQFYEMKDPDYGAPSHLVEKLEETFNHPKKSGSDYVLDPTPMEQDHEKSQPRQSTRERIPRHRFEIEEEAFDDCST